MNLRRTRAIARKEFLHITRDPRSLIMALAIPFLLLLLFGYALSLDVDRIPTLVYDGDKSPQSRVLIARLNGSRYFDLFDPVDSTRAIEDAIDRDQCLLGVVIPRDYARKILSGEKVAVQLLLDGSDSNTASIARGYAESVIRELALELRAEALNLKGAGVPRPPVEARLRVWYNSEMKSRNYIVPGLIAVIIMIIAAMLTSLTIAREWEMGTMEQLLSTPVRPTELVLGKMSAFFSVGLIDMIIAMAVGALVFQVPLRGSLVLAVAVSCLFLFGALGWGILISSVARQQLLAYQMGIISSFLPAFILSGFIYAIENMPAVIQVITHIFPARYFVTILKGIFLKGVGLSILWVEVVFLIVYGALVFVIATRKLKKKIV